MIVSATNGESHFSALTASMALYEAGLFDVLDITPTTGVLEPARVARDPRRRHAARRLAARRTSPPSTTSPWPTSRSHALRADLGIPPRAA